MSDLSGFVVPALSRKKLREIAWNLRNRLGLEKEPWLPVVPMMELALDTIAPGFTFEVRERDEMGKNHGLTDISDRTIQIREDIYNGAYANCGRDRMTFLHEIGHAILHSDIAFGRRIGGEIKTYEQPEWQAKAFAGELAICSRLIGGCKNHSDLMKRFGVSEDAAKIQMEQFQKEDLWLPPEKKANLGWNQSPLF